MTAELTAAQAELYCPTCEQVFGGSVGQVCPDDGTRLVRLNNADPFVGRELDGRYTMLEKLGEGGMGAVYRARQHSMGREVAVKVLAPALVRDAGAIKRFLREAKLASRLAHPNVVSVLDFGQTSDGVFYLVMELVAGRTLHEVLVREVKLPVPRIVRIASQICDALEGAHAIPIIHRDLKPANVMLLSAGRDLVKVLDFGLAKSLDVSIHETTVTGSGALLGTPTYMPPEIANGGTVDDRADLYSLGCILYQMACGRPPFIAEAVPEMIAMHGTVPAPPARGVPRPLAEVIERLLRKDPDERYISAAAVREALERADDEIRRHGGDSDTEPHDVSEEDTLEPPESSPAPAGAETLDSGLPQRPSELAVTKIYDSAPAASTEDHRPSATALPSLVMASPVSLATAAPPAHMTPPAYVPPAAPPQGDRPRHDPTVLVGERAAKRGRGRMIAGALLAVGVAAGVLVATRSDREAAPVASPSADTGAMGDRPAPEAADLTPAPTENSPPASGKTPSQTSTNTLTPASTTTETTDTTTPGVATTTKSPAPTAVTTTSTGAMTTNVRTNKAGASKAATTTAKAATTTRATTTKAGTKAGTTTTKDSTATKAGTTTTKDVTTKRPPPSVGSGYDSPF